MESFDLQGQRMFPLALKHLAAQSFAAHNPLIVQHKGAQFLLTRGTYSDKYTAASDYWCGHRRLSSLKAVRAAIRSATN